MTKPAKAQTTKNVKTTDATAVLINGLAQLIEGQKRFATEFGLSTARVFPGLDHLLQTEDLASSLQQWLLQGDVGIGQMQQLFACLAQHQLALMAALDGIALQTINTLAGQLHSNGPLKSRLSGLLKSGEQQSWQNLKANQQLRYQKLIVPGFVDTYIQVRETAVSAKTRTVSFEGKNCKEKTNV
ncbi:MAG: hypothetical protein HWD59_02085 [Coxiellaceae bacterium]|nr:MAG: hypothetical protein HWD59_02085 [Coxiellaceae bacterium]